MNKKLQASGRRRTKDHTMLDARPVESFPRVRSRSFFFGTVSGCVVVFRLSGQGPLGSPPTSGELTMLRIRSNFQFALATTAAALMAACGAETEILGNGSTAQTRASQTAATATTNASPDPLLPGRADLMGSASGPVNTDVVDAKKTGWRSGVRKPAWTSNDGVVLEDGSLANYFQY